MSVLKEKKDRGFTLYKSESPVFWEIFVIINSIVGYVL